MAPAAIAYGQVSSSGNLNVGGFSDTRFGFPVPPLFPAQTASANASKTKIGFALGAGAEGRLTSWLSPAWTWKVEYLYVDLGSLNAAVPVAQAADLFDLAGGGIVNVHTHFSDDIVRVGINYKLGGM
jgi:opacity protein-like surface antigen